MPIDKWLSMSCVRMKMRSYLEEKPDSELVTKGNPSKEMSTADVESKFMEFLRTAKSLECFSKFSKVKRLFMKFNTTIPSSAPVKRLFSLGNLVFNPRRNRLNDEKFQQLLLLRYNKDFVDLS